MTTVALVGATGNFGHKLLPYLVAEESIVEIRCLSRHPRQSHTSQKVKDVKVDYQNLGALGSALGGCDVLINAMGTNMDHLSSKKALVDAAAITGVKVYIPR